MGVFKILRQLTDRRPRVHFLHIGKTGGTSIKSALKPYRDKFPVNIHMHSHDTTLRDVPVGEGFFFFLRNPVTRFVSSFNSRLRMGRPRINNPWSPEEEIAFKHFSTADRLALALLSPNTAERAAAERAMRGIGHVNDFYSRWFESEEYFLSRLADVVLIGFQETLNQDFEILKIRLGLPVEIQLPRDEVSTHRTPAGMNQKLPPESIAVIEKWYATDFKFYALCQKLAAEKSTGKSLLTSAIKSAPFPDNKPTRTSPRPSF
jgi:hypothetical protein